MKNLGDDLKATLLQLSTRERAELAHLLISSLDDTIDADAEAEWDKELLGALRRSKKARRSEGQPSKCWTRSERNTDKAWAFDVRVG